MNIEKIGGRKFLAWLLGFGLWATVVIWALATKSELLVDFAKTFTLTAGLPSTAIYAGANIYTKKIRNGK